MEFEHAKFGKCVTADFTQGQFEVFSEAVPDTAGLKMTVFRGATIRAAVKSGILLEPKLTVEQVAEIKPNLAIWLAECLGKAIAEATDIDPLS